MRVLFLVHAMSRTRHFESVIRLLADAGHTVRLGVHPTEGGPRLPEPLQGHPRISAVECPFRRFDEWRDFVGPLRLARDYVRYLDPRYRKARTMAKRARRVAPEGFVRFAKEHRSARKCWRLLELGLGMVEDAIPSDYAFEEFIRTERPDVVLVTPLVYLGSYQTEYVKSSHRLGVPVAFLPFSWDNLTNKGLIRVSPDRVLVWNETQRWEATALHGVPTDRIVVTGAPRFDDFFARRPSLDRKSFCRRVGLNHTRQFILYLCSSETVAPREAEFVERWVGELRRSTDPLVRECGILVRPHPAHARAWLGTGRRASDNVAMWRSDTSKQGDASLFESLHHAAAVVGLNTSAMIEAGILGKSVHTMRPERHVDGDRATLHYEYLLHANGGLVTEATGFDQHLIQLSKTLAAPDGRREQCRRFIEGFIRPRGIDHPVTPIMAQEIERIGRMRKRPGTALSLKQVAMRSTVRGWATRQNLIPPPGSPAGRNVPVDSTATLHA